MKLNYIGASALAVIAKEIRETRLALRVLLAQGFTRNGAFVGGYKTRLIKLRRARLDIRKRQAGEGI